MLDERTGNLGIEKVRIRLPKILKDLWKQRHIVVALLEDVIWDLQTRLQPALMYKHVYSENVHSIAICSITISRLRSLQLQFAATYLKSISSTLIELISTTNMLKSTITGEPFFEGGRISAINQVDLRLANIGCEQFICEIAPHAALKTRGKNFRARIHFKRGASVWTAQKNVYKRKKKSGFFCEASSGAAYGLNAYYTTGENR